MRVSVPYLAARAFICILGLVAVTWVGLVFPTFWQQLSLSQIASEYVRGHALPMPLLLDEARQTHRAEQATLCNPTTLHDVVILRLAIVEEAMQQTNTQLISSTYSPLDDAISGALACTPTDSAAWLILFWQELIRHRSAETNTMNYLRLSYMLGPNEGWIALWRNHLAVTIFEQLPDDLKNDALDEFVKLVATERLYRETAAIFGQAAPVVRGLIIQRLGNIAALPRQIFVKVLYEKGLAQGIPEAWMEHAKPWNAKPLDLNLPEAAARQGQP
jgi:hypothetical protein